MARTQLKNNMFTGIIEALGEVTKLEKEGSNLHITMSSPFTKELKIDQSVAHNGTCLTVIAIDGDEYTVTAIDETLVRTNIGQLQVGSKVNLERCMQMGGRLDGHIVQGHVDTVGELLEVKELDGSWELYFKHPKGADGSGYVTVEKGSITINGISLTVVNSTPTSFSVALIPYTWDETNMHTLSPGDQINLEFDIIGKYVARMMAANQISSAS